MRFLTRLQIGLAAVLLPGVGAAAQELSSADIHIHAHEVQPVPSPVRETNSLPMPAENFMKRIAFDQKQFWTGPTRMTAASARSLLPFVAFTGILMRSDGWIDAQVPDRSGQLKRSLNLSHDATYSLLAVGAGSFLWGHEVHDDHLQESGLLSGEAAINAAGVAYLLQQSIGRVRPGAPGADFSSYGQSFPSVQSAAAWAVASTVAHEYPGPLTKFLVYGLASTVTLTQVTSREGFASDAFVGSALGWYMARQVYGAHHDIESGGGPWGDFHFLPEEPGSRAQNMASPYEPLDSWVYPALERLAALGYVNTEFLSQRPWTRLECARLVEEAGEAIPVTGSADSPASKLYRALALEFAGETRRLEGARNLGASVDSIYSRYTGISGDPLRDGFHFAETLPNDYGRPYGEGGNVVSGTTLQAEAGPWAFSLRAEYQQSPATSAYPLSVLQALASADNHPPISNAAPPVGRMQILESLAALDFHNTQFSVGKQSLALGPSRSGSLLLGNNAAPFLMFRVDSTTGYEIPLLSQVLGLAKSQFFIGQLSGQLFVNTGSAVVGPKLSPQPFIHGERISFAPTANFEFGMGINVMFGGPGLPFTWSNFLRTYYVHSASVADNPGKRFSSFDFTYRLPRLRNWVTAYLDSLVVDEVSPIGSRRPSLNPGLYFPRLPKLARAEFRVEGLKTAQAPHTQFPPGYVYTDRRYLSGYTNDGQLMGSWIGRAGIGGQAWATYHFSARNLLELSFRHMEVDHAFLEGGHLNDFSVQSQLRLRPDLTLSSLLQYERWAFPLLAGAPRSNFVTSLQLTYCPRLNRKNP